jgi:hypothetical protein
LLKKSDSSSTQGALWYDFDAGTWDTFAGEAFSHGYSVSIVGGVVYICAAKSTSYRLYKYTRGALTLLGAVPSSTSIIKRVVAYGTGILCVGSLTSFTPDGGSPISTKGGIYFDGTNWNALTTSIPEGLNLDDVIVKAGVAYAADSGANYGCVYLDGTDWKAMSAGLQSAGSNAHCIAEYDGSMYLGGELYTTGWVTNLVVKWNGSAWVGVSAPSYIPLSFASTPTKLVMATATAGRVYEYDGSWSYISGSSCFGYCAEKNMLEERYFASEATGVFERASGSWTELGDVINAQNLAYGFVA